MEGQPHPPPAAEVPHYLPHQVVWRVLSSGISSPVIEPIVAPPVLAGKLTLVILKAKRLHNVCSFGTMDPFVEAKIGGGETEMRQRTSVCKRGHVDPNWASKSGGESLHFLLHGSESVVRIRVFHKTMLGETVVGTARLPLDFLLLHHGRSPASSSLPSPINCANPTLNTAWIDIGRDAKQATPAGSLLVSVHFEFLGHPANRGLLAHCTLPNMDPARQQHFHLTPDPITEVPVSGTLGSLGNTPPLDASSAAAASAAPSTPFRLKQRAASTSSPSLQLPSQSGASASPRGSVIVGPSTPSNRPLLFGGTLANGMARSKSSVPVVVFVCVSYLLHHGLKCVGLFRISSQSEAQDALKRAFESGSSIEVSDPHVTGDVLKTYFRQLRDPLIPGGVYQSFLNATDMTHEEESLPMLRKLLEQLPQDNYNVLSYLLHFLTLVAAHADLNKMTAKNCALVFSPNILRKVTAGGPPGGVPETQASVAREMQRAEDCIHLMITHYKALFPEGPPKPFEMHHPSKDRPSVATLRQQSGDARERQATRVSRRSCYS